MSDFDIPKAKDAIEVLLADYMRLLNSAECKERMRKSALDDVVSGGEVIGDLNLAVHDALCETVHEEYRKKREMESYIIDLPPELSE